MVSFTLTGWNYYDVPQARPGICEQRILNFLICFTSSLNHPCIHCRSIVIWTMGLVWLSIPWVSVVMDGQSRRLRLEGSAEAFCGTCHLSFKFQVDPSFLSCLSWLSRLQFYLISCAWPLHLLLSFTVQGSLLCQNRWFFLNSDFHNDVLFCSSLGCEDMGWTQQVLLVSVWKSCCSELQ